MSRFEPELEDAQLQLGSDRYFHANGDCVAVRYCSELKLVVGVDDPFISMDRRIFDGNVGRLRNRRSVKESRRRSLSWVCARVANGYFTCRRFIIPLLGDRGKVSVILVSVTRNLHPLGLTRPQVPGGGSR